MSTAFRQLLFLRGIIRARARGVDRVPVRASLEYWDDEGQPALIPLRWNRSELSLQGFRDREVLVGGYLGTDGRGYPVFYVHECALASSRTTPRPTGAPASGGALAS